MTLSSDTIDKAIGEYHAKFDRPRPRWLRILLAIVALVVILVLASSALCWPCGNACKSDNDCRTGCSCSFTSGKCT